MKALLARLVMGGASAAGGAPIWLWAILILSGIIVAQEGLRRVQTATLRAEVQEERAGRSKDREEASAAALRKAGEYAAETARRIKDQQENESATNQQAAAAARDRDVAVAAHGRLSRAFAAYAAAHGGAAPDSPAAAGGTPAGATGDLRADVFSRIDQAAGELAAYADAARISGQLCARDYEALTVTRASRPAAHADD